MSKLYIFGIGGTGSRVLRSLTMMMASGVKMGTDEIVPIIIDPDAANADLTRTVDLMDNYCAVRSNLKFTAADPTQFFRIPIRKVLPNYTMLIQDTSTKTFRQFVGLASMDKSSQAMMRMLFSEKNLNASMQVGFKGNPNIGSVVLNQIVKTNDFQEFANGFAQGDRIFIISSIFGGTGASGFPLLLKTLRQGKNFPNFKNIHDAEIGAITILPYFNLTTNDESEIDSSTFISKTKSALAYYEQNISGAGEVNALYFLGDDVTNTYENVEGGAGQHNDAHIVEFLAASAIVDFSNTTYQQGQTTNKEFGLKDSAGASVCFRDFDDHQCRDLFMPLTQFLQLSNCLTHEFSYFSGSSFAANYDNFANLYSSNFMRDLQKVCNCYLGWLREMKNNKRSLNLYNLDDTKKPFDIVTGYKAKSVFSTKSNYDLIADRLNGGIKQCVTHDECNKFLEMYHRGLERVITEKLK